MGEREGLTRREVLRRCFYGGLGVLGLEALAVAGCRRAPVGPWPNILLITLDTTRRDRLGCYGHGRPTSPNLDRLAAGSLRYTRAIAPSNWTLPSHASLFTGKFTTSHGARFDPEGPLSLVGLEGPPEFWRRFRARGLSPAETTLAMMLREEGYATGGVGAGPWMKRAFGLDRGFDFWDDDHIGTANGRPASAVTPAALRWLEARGEERFFLFLNYFDPHFPYSPPLEFARRFLPAGTDPAKLNPYKPSLEERSALYDAEILFMDHHLGLLLEEMKRLGLYDNTWIIVTSDHGEMLGEHGLLGHGKKLHQEEIHIPLLMKYPEGEAAAGTVDDDIQLTDIMPMVLRRLGLPAPPGIQGGVPPKSGHPTIAEYYPLEFLSPDGDAMAIIEGSMKYLWSAGGGEALYDLAADPGEEDDLSGREPGRARKMKRKLEKYLAGLPPPPPGGEGRTVDEETREALKGLGYLE
jgi:arylsulfatase A-like enzyme